MLSVVSIKKSSVDSGYYLKQDGNYYIEEVNQKSLYQWMGEGAKRLGLTGAIDPEVHKAVYNGQLSDGIVVGKRHADGSLNGRPGYDLTFSMNKEISLIVCCTDDKILKDYFLNAHMHAVKMAMYEIEKMVSARKTINGNTQYEVTQNMVASLCTHFSSRAGDPQVHTHALIANTTQRSDGEWRALSTDMQRKHGFYEKVRDHATYLGHIYQNEMARAAREKGFSLTRTNKHGMFAIASFPDDVKQHFSKRRQQIESIVNSLNFADRNDKILYNNIAQHSKGAKEKINHRDFIQKSKASMELFLTQHHPGKHFDDIVHGCIERNKSDITPLSNVTKEAVLDAIESLSRFNVKLNANQIIEKAIELDLGTSSVSTLQQTLTHMVQVGVLHRVDSGHFTSQTLRDTEQRLINKIQRAEKSGESVPLSPQTVKESLQQHRFCIIEEPKSLKDKLRLIDTLMSEFESQRKTVRLLTPTKSLAFDHNRYQRSQTKSFWQQLKWLGKEDQAHGLHGFIHQYEESTANPIANLFTQTGKEIFLVDDSQGLSLEVTEKLIDLSEKRQAHLVFLSSEHNKQRLLASNAVLLLKESGVPIVQWQGSKSQLKNEPTKLTIHGVSGEYSTDRPSQQQARQSRVAQTVVSQFGHHLAAVDVIAMTSRSAKQQSQLIRDELKNKGLLGSDEHRIITEHRVYLTQEEQKHAKSFKKGWMTKTYVGRGQFVSQTIVGVDRHHNRLLIKGGFGRTQRVLPRQLLKQSNTILIKTEDLALSNQERIVLTGENRQSKQLGLSTHTTYQVTLENNKVILVPDNSQLKTINAKLKHLNGMSWSHHYVNTIHQVRHIKRSTKTAIIDAPSYALNKNRINDLVRQYAYIDIYTDDARRAEKKIGMTVSTPLSTALALKPLVETAVERAVDYGLSVVASREAAFLLTDLTKKAMEYSLETVTHAEVQSAIAQRVSKGELQLRESLQGLMMATSNTVALEQALIGQIKQGKNALRPLIDKAVVDQALITTTLTEGQKAACRLLAASSDRFVMVQGYAGTGKSTLLKTLKKLLQEKSDDCPSMIALAPTHKAVRELQDKGIDSQTLKSFLVERADGLNSSLQQSLIILDESSMVSNTDFHQLQSIVEQSNNTHCAYLGDIAQLLAVEQGKPSEIVYLSKEADIATATMGDILRQKNPVLKRVTQQLIEGTPQSIQTAFNLLDRHHSIIVPKTSDRQARHSTGLTAWETEKAANQLKVTDAIDKLARDYVQLPVSERQNTLIAVATNQTRQTLNASIRHYLAESGEISGPALSMNILSHSRLTNEELRYTNQYHSGDVVKLSQSYYEVIDIFRKDNAIRLRDTVGQERTYKLDWLVQHEFEGLFRKAERLIQVGDQLKWTKSDKSRGLVAHDTMSVMAVDHQAQSIEVRNRQGESMQIDLTIPNNQHLDYCYASTVHGLQGATAKRVLSLLISPNQKANTLRLMYVVATRAAEEAYFYVDDKKAVIEQIATHKGDKASALEVMDLLKTKQQRRSVNIPTHTSPQKKHEYASRITPQSTVNTIGATPRIDAKVVENHLRAEVQTICESLFGQPNQSFSNATNWRYGHKGSLSINVGGQHQGSFHNFETGEKGGMIQLLMSELGMDFKSALEHGHRLLGDPLSVIPKQVLRERTVVKDDASTRKQMYIKKLVERSVPILGTVAEAYLKKRAIRSTQGLDLRYIEEIKTGRGNELIRSKAAALLAIARNSLGEVSALQLTYLDPKEADKIESLKIQKRTIGSLKGATVNLTPKIQSPDMTFVAEGIETGLSVRDAIPANNKETTQVLATLGKSNLSNISKQSASKIVLVLDNDQQGWQQDKSIQSAVSDLEQQGKSVFCIQPRSLNHQKTDYNDVAQVGQFNEIRQDMARAIAQLNRNSEQDHQHDFSSSHQKSPETSDRQSKTLDRDREILG